MIARRQSSGVPVWSSLIANERISGSNIVVRDNVVVAAISHEAVGLDAATGRQVWRYAPPLDTAWVPLGSPSYPGTLSRTHFATSNDVVYIPAWGASISAVDLATGAAHWVWQPGQTAADTAARGRFRSGSDGVTVSGDTVYATGWHFLDADGLSAEAWLIALDAATGRELWRATMPKYTSGVLARGAPVVSGRLVIFETAGGHEFAIDRFTTQLAWEYVPDTQHGTDSQTELYDGVVYHDGGDGFIYALRAVDGSRVWRSSPGMIAAKDLLITDRRVLYSDGMTFHVLDRATGRELLSVQQPRTSDSFFASPAVSANGQIFVTVGGGAWSFDEP